ncbi:hypothetical protein E2C01_018415 [Portunus trituberculatus]|uniref:Uncharacterized protein n=1 Tax=Portunus trituberculatus TaxID=210409 RepID=A0A5B7DW33_PORTR|nr:hypothetical protein [Portunus trituberculatus]
MQQKCVPQKNSQNRRLMWKALLEGNPPSYSDLKMTSRGPGTRETIYWDDNGSERWLPWTGYLFPMRTNCLKKKKAPHDAECLSTTELRPPSQSIPAWTTNHPAQDAIPPADYKVVSKMAWTFGLTTELYAETHPWVMMQKGQTGQVALDGELNFLSRIDWKFLQWRYPVHRRHMSVVVAGPSRWVLNVVSQRGRDSVAPLRVKMRRHIKEMIHNSPMLMWTGSVASSHCTQEGDLAKGNKT